MIFISNKYNVWYFNITAQAQLRNVAEKYEIHHIVPRSLGGTDEPNNLVKLTLKEHLVVHHLLTKITMGEDRVKMIYSFNMMSNFKKYNGKKYTKIREEFYKAHSIRMSGENHPNYGKKQKKSTIEKRLKNTNRDSLKSQLGKKKELHPSYGKSLTDRHKEAISNTSKGHKKPAGFMAGTQNSNYGKRHPGSRTGSKNAMYGLIGGDNPNFGSRRTEEQKYNLKIGKIQENIEVYLSVVNRLQSKESVDFISKETGISQSVVYKIKNGSHIIHQYIKKNAVYIKK